MSKRGYLFFTSVCLYISLSKLLDELGCFPVMPFARLLGDNRYRESPIGTSHVQELLLGEVIRKSDVIDVERNLLCDF